jgi:hypothetical protein
LKIIRGGVSSEAEARKQTYYAMRGRTPLHPNLTLWNFVRIISCGFSLQIPNQPKKFLDQSG